MENKEFEITSDKKVVAKIKCDGGKCQIEPTEEGKTLAKKHGFFGCCK